MPRALSIIIAALALAFAAPTLSACSSTDPSENAMKPDVADLATRSLRAGDEGLAARRQLEDLANWETASVDLRPAAPALIAALESTKPGAAHRAVDALGRMARHTARGHSLGFLDREVPPHVRRPFFVDALPAIAKATREGEGESRARAVEALASIALAARAAGASDLTALREAAEAASTSGDAAVAAAGKSALSQIAGVDPR